jgi:2-polyprenyl-6-methoxyphenol hydroxylase-like FAD-dependent oxidoreductase
MTHALVVGGSIAGLLAARVAANHFDQVTLLERDPFLDTGPAHRRGVPQAHHLHILLMRGQAIFEQLLPGLTADMERAGAPRIDSAQDLLWRNPAGWGVRFRSGLTKLAFTRDLLDWHVRQHLVHCRQVTVRGGAEVADLEPEARGVRLLDGERIAADLVIDASGRGSRAPRWLQALGYQAPPEEVVDAHLGYASRLYRKTPVDWQGVYVQAAPPHSPRAGVVFSVEDDRWLVTLAGTEPRPPTDDAGFVSFARTLPSPLVYETVSTAEALSPIVATRSGGNRLRHFERLPDWPQRFVVIGDAACAFNPVYGQGMTVAALEALALDDCLTRGDAASFRHRLARIVALPWALATGEDSRYLGTEGARLDRRTRFLHRYMDHVLALATERVDVRRTMLEVQHMLRPPSALFGPGIAALVAARALPRLREAA